MIEFPQSVPNLTEASSNLYECIKGRNLLAYPDDELRLAVSRCVAIETARGWRIAKEKQSHKIDVVVALAMAALGAVQQGQVKVEFAYTRCPRIPGYFDERPDQLYTSGQEWCDRMDAQAAYPLGQLIKSRRWGGGAY